jgi:hypothetical protein
VWSCRRRWVRGSRARSRADPQIEAVHGGPGAETLGECGRLNRPPACPVGPARPGSDITRSPRSELPAEMVTCRRSRPARQLSAAARRIDSSAGMNPQAAQRLIPATELPASAWSRCGSSPSRDRPGRASHSPDARSSPHPEPAPTPPSLPARAAPSGRAIPPPAPAPWQATHRRADHRSAADRPPADQSGGAPRQRQTSRDL